jgi:succinate-semialdehyde dehydrogenase / glutarate-semialdehyde dehydrogenase
MRFMKEETFGPTAFLVGFDSDEEVIRKANNTNAGLASYMFVEQS